MVSNYYNLLCDIAFEGYTRPHVDVDNRLKLKLRLFISWKDLDNHFEVDKGRPSRYEIVYIGAVSSGYNNS